MSAVSAVPTRVGCLHQCRQCRQCRHGLGVCVNVGSVGIAYAGRILPLNVGSVGYADMSCMRPLTLSTQG